MYTLNDFFCGCGGLGLGFQNAGFKIVGAWDFDKYAVATYRENVGDHVVQADIQKMHIEDVPKAEATKAGIAVGRYGDAINIAYPESNTRRGRVGKEIAQSLLTGCSQVVICDKKGGENDT